MDGISYTVCMIDEISLRAAKLCLAMAVPTAMRVVFDTASGLLGDDDTTALAHSHESLCGDPSLIASLTTLRRAGAWDVSLIAVA